MWCLDFFRHFWLNSRNGSRLTTSEAVEMHVFAVWLPGDWPFFFVLFPWPKRLLFLKLLLNWWRQQGVDSRIVQKELAPSRWCHFNSFHMSCCCPFFDSYIPYMTWLLSYSIYILCQVLWFLSIIGCYDVWSECFLMHHRPIQPPHQLPLLGG